MSNNDDLFLITEDRRILEKVIFPFFVHSHDFQNVLFIGCDWHTKGYEDIFKDKNYWTIDFDPVQAKFGARQHVNDRLENLSLHFEENIFDLIICNGVLGAGLNLEKHVEKAFLECFYCLRDGGIFIVGWNDISERRPLPYENIEALKLFEPYLFGPLSTTQYLTDTSYRHTYNFYIKTDVKNYKARQNFGRKNILENNGFNALVKAKYGYFIYNKNDIFIGRSVEKYGEFSEAELFLIKQLCEEGDVIIDIGANIGTHTLAFSKIVGESGKVIAFEPQKIIFQTLCGNMAINSITNVDCFQLAVYSQSKSFFIPEIQYNKINDFGSVDIKTEENGIKVRAIVLDDFLDVTQLKLMKIDAEGMEYEVLLGASQLIKNLRPFIYLENEKPEKSKRLIELLQSLDYRLFWHFPCYFNPKNFNNCLEDQYPGMNSVNMFCFHKSLDMDVADLSEVTDPDLHPLI